MSLFESFRTFILTRRLLGPDDRVLLAISGGVDSVVMAHLFRQAAWFIGIAHCNFQLRGAESDGDEAFVRELAAAWDIPVFVQRFETKKYAAEKGLSTQMAARELRYDWFEKIRLEQGFHAVATGHNTNDSVETALLHFIRGTGLSGLGGIPVRNRQIIRPLLFATREQIAIYAQENQLRWREDSSNATDDYTRNVVRHHILPRMQEINPAFLTAAGRTLGHLRAADANLRFFLDQLLGQPDPEGVYRLDKKQLEALPALADALFDLLQPFGFLPEQARQMAENWGQTGSEWQADSGFRLLIDRQNVLLFQTSAAERPLQIAADDLLVRLPDGHRLALTPALPGTPFPDPGEGVLADAEKVQFPLHLRHWQPGDTFQPLGMEGKSQKVQDFLTNQKMSKLEKENCWILENGDRKIIWILGMRLDERFKVEANTTKLLKFSWIKKA